MERFCLSNSRSFWSWPVLIKLGSGWMWVNFVSVLDLTKIQIIVKVYLYLRNYLSDISENWQRWEREHTNRRISGIQKLFIMRTTDLTKFLFRSGFKNLIYEFRIFFNFWYLASTPKTANDYQWIKKQMLTLTKVITTMGSSPKCVFISDLGNCSHLGYII